VNRRRPHDELLADAINRVLAALNALEPDESIKHDELCRRTGLASRLAWEAISAIDGTYLLLGGLPATGYMVARHRGDGARRTSATFSQGREMFKRGQRRCALEDTLPEPPCPDGDEAA
jgi:hypothetical protein